MGIIKPKEIIRITLGDEIPDIEGVYVLAYMGRIVYVGKAECGVLSRLKEHINNAIDELLGAWIMKNRDWENIRLDILVPPISKNMRLWVAEVEDACIKRFDPLLNIQLMKG